MPSKYFKKIQDSTPQHIKRWVDVSFSIQDLIAEAMEEQNLFVEDVRELTGLPELRVNLNDFKLSEIAKLEEALGVKLIEVVQNKEREK